LQDERWRRSGGAEWLDRSSPALSMPVRGGLADRIIRFPSRSGVLPVAYPTVINRCPVCGEELTVTRLHCQVCDTGIEGRFRLGRFGRLSNEQLAFVEVFLKNRGIIKDVEAELGLSYPTVRARLDEALKAMGFAGAAGEDGARSRLSPAQVREEQRKILEEVGQKRISAEEAARRISRIGQA
jgi:hypothetical protein